MGSLLTAGWVLTQDARCDEYAAQELAIAARNGDVDHVRQLLSRGVDPNSRHRCGWTALHVAVANGQQAVVEHLLQHGADPNVADRYTPKGGNMSQVMHQMRARAFEFSSAVNPDASAAGFTALHYAALLSDVKIMDALLMAGADPSAKDAEGCVPADYTDSQALKHKLETSSKRIQQEQDVRRKQQLEEERKQRQLFPLEQRVKKYIVGQEGAISTVASAIRRRENGRGLLASHLHADRTRSLLTVCQSIFVFSFSFWGLRCTMLGWQDEDHPLVFLFLGSSGVGKTELSKRIAEVGLVRHVTSTYSEHTLMVS